MIFNDSDKLFLVYNEDYLSIEKLAKILKCKGHEIIKEYDKMLSTGEYYMYQAEKFRIRKIRV